MELIFLADRPEILPQIARWHFDEWGHRRPGSSIEATCTNLQAYLNRDRIPLMVLAQEHNRVVGTASLKYREMDIYPEREHWLGGVFVDTTHRGRGIGSRLAERIAVLARSLNVDILHLQTERLDGGLYANLGWEPQERVRYKGADVLVMERLLKKGRASSG